MGIASKTAGLSELSMPSRPRTHPLDPLSADEIRAAANCCKAYGATNHVPPLRFNTITLQEPPKQQVLEVLAWGPKEGGPLPPRRALCVLELPSTDQVVEAYVDLTLHTTALPPLPAALPVGGDEVAGRRDEAAGKRDKADAAAVAALAGWDGDGVGARVVSWTTLDGVQPTLSIDDCEEAEAIMKKDPEFRRLVSERYGITDMTLLACDPWYCGERFATKEDTPVGRQMMLWLYVRMGDPDDNFYAHPLDMVVDIDLNRRSILKVFHYDAVPKIPELARNYHRRLLDRPFRSGIRPLHVVQPEGPSFSVDGRLVRWQKWTFHVGFNFREGLVLSDIRYQDRGLARPVLHRLSAAEVMVPYSDPRAPYSRKCAFDAVDYGLGQCASPLELGCDCLGHIRYFDAAFVSKDGQPTIIRKAVCMHEEDVGISWKHLEYRTGHNEVRRMRRLVVSFITTIANYDYGFYYSLYQDGSIGVEVKLTGILSTNIYAGEDGPRPAYGQLVAPLLNAQHHQHFFCFRIDPSVDDARGGGRLTVAEVNCEPQPTGTPSNPKGVAFRVVETELESELRAQRMGCLQSSRYWKVKNRASLNPVNGEPVSFKLLPFPTPPMYCHPSSMHGSRGVWAQCHLWVTQYKDGEMCPAGEYPLRLDGRQNGIDTWTRQDRALVDEDVVLWYNLGLTHVVRIEDFPVMPVEVIGFKLAPCNFFDCNPAIDLPPTCNEMSTEQQQQQNGNGDATRVCGACGGGSGSSGSCSTCGSGGGNGGGGAQGMGCARAKL